MKKSFVFGAVLSLSTLCFAGQKPFDVRLSSPSTVGGVQLKAGDYKVVVEGDTATFTDQKLKSVSAPVKVETAAEKYRGTVVEASDEGGLHKVKAIQIGGSTTKLQFAN
jgi:hypothetical protein